MEPVFMILGQSAGIAAVLAIQHDITVQDIPYEDLQQALLDANQVLHWSQDMQDDPIKRMEETFGG
jgi:hypothetical protein